uniref:23 kDa jasmonate-induced protein-like n=1 Tax=Erigeron canadensis TaxID=72917 RepID=UPI001CB960B6|nr:23 kDa jasmonate-induced protein-like [Erigeron canadensis]
MACNVFGKPVRGESRLDRALKALEDTNLGGKRDQAIQYVKHQQLKAGAQGGLVCTLTIFYNATGETLFYAEDHSKYGKIYDSYPARVHNGQWGAFLHIKRSVAPTGSEGFVVYRGKCNNTDFCKQLIAWDVPVNQAHFDNHAYCDIYADDWDINKDKVYKRMEAGSKQHTTTKKGMVVTSSIDEGICPLYEAQFTLDEDDANGGTFKGPGAAPTPSIFPLDNTVLSVFCQKNIFF